MQSIPFQISWNNFTWWVNDQKYQWQAGRYYTWFNVDTRRYDVRPSLTNELVRTYEDNINCVFNQATVSSSSDNIVWLDNGKIYNDDWVTATLKHTLSVWKQWYRIGTMNVWWVQKLYYFHDTLPSITPKYIHRSNTNGWSFDENYKQYTSTTWNDSIAPLDWMQVISEWARILFSHYNNIFEMDNVSETPTLLIAFPSNENVVWITNFQWEYKVYTTIGFTTSKIYRWDGTSALPTTSIDLDWLAVSSVVNDWAYDYMFADQSMYMVAWVQYQMVYNAIQGRFLGKVENDLYIEYNSPTDSAASIWIYGNIPGYPKSITPKYAIKPTDITGWEVRQYTRVVFSSSTVYYTTWTGFYKIGWAGATISNFTSYIESLVFIWDNIQYEKTVTEIILKFSWATANCKMQVQTQTQESGSWTTIWEWINTDIDWVNHWLKIPHNMFLNPIGKFNTIRFRVRFISNGQTTCRFYGLDLIWTQNIWK